MGALGLARVAAVHEAGEGLLIVARYPLRVLADPGVELALQLLQIPARALAPNPVQRLARELPPLALEERQGGRRRHRMAVT